MFTQGPNLLTLALLSAELQAGHSMRLLPERGWQAGANGSPRLHQHLLIRSNPILLRKPLPDAAAGGCRVVVGNCCWMHAILLCTKWSCRTLDPRRSRGHREAGVGASGKHVRYVSRVARARRGCAGERAQA